MVAKIRLYFIRGAKKAQKSAKQVKKNANKRKKQVSNLLISIRFVSFKFL